MITNERVMKGAVRDGKLLQGRWAVLERRAVRASTKQLVHAMGHDDFGSGARNAIGRLGEVGVPGVVRNEWNIVSDHTNACECVLHKS